MHKLKVLELPFPLTAAIRDPTLFTSGADLFLAMEFDDEGQTRPTSLPFVKARALRKRAEIHCTSWHVKDAYDTLCEVQGSDWVEELRSDSVPEWRDRRVMCHFMIYFDSFGCLEVIADDAILDNGVKNFSG